MKNSFLPLIIITLISWSWLIWLTIGINGQPKVAYVKSIYLVENYKGTKEAYKVLQEKAVEWQVQLDSLEELYKQSFQNYQENKAKVKGNALQLLEQDLVFKKNNFENYQQIIKQKEEEEGKQLTQGVYSQIDSYLKAYAKKEGYDLVIGANAEGTVLYGSDAFDITEEVLAIINQNYSGGGK